jgi:hypothetical protein
MRTAVVRSSRRITHISGSLLLNDQVPPFLHYGVTPAMLIGSEIEATLGRQANANLQQFCSLGIEGKAHCSRFVSRNQPLLTEIYSCLSSALQDISA